MVEVVYQPRNPKLSSLYQSILNHFAEFESVYFVRKDMREDTESCEMSIPAYKPT